jgi:hypothetical protein
MSRMSVLALAAILALGSISIATEASARGGHIGGGRGFGGAAHFGGGGHFGGFHSGFARRGFGFGLPYYGLYAYNGCWRSRRVLTPYGWLWRRVNVCYSPYY